MVTRERARRRGALSPGGRGWRAEPVAHAERAAGGGVERYRSPARLEIGSPGPAPYVPTNLRADDQRHRHAASTSGGGDRSPVNRLPPDHRHLYLDIRDVVDGNGHEVVR